MKKLKLIAIVLLLTLFTACMFSCGGGGDTEDKLTLINGDGSLNFVIVLGDGIDADTRFRFVQLKSTLKDLGETLEVIDYDDEPREDTVEVLVGDVSTRGDEYAVDPHSLGHEGYVVKIVNNKIVINGGTADAIHTAVDYFIEEILLIDEDTEELTSAVMAESQNKEYIFTEYDITSLKIGDNDIRDFKIAVDMSNYVYNNKAIDLRNAIYDECGVYLDIVDLSTEPERAIFIKEVTPDNTPKDSFRAYEKDGNFYIVCEYFNRYEENFDLFVLRHITAKDGDLVLAGNIFSTDVSYLTYEQFGAKGDGVANDFPAIYKAHEQANITGLELRVNQTATYRITDTSLGGVGAKEINIRTSVYWGNATFIIDDKDLTPDNPKQIHDNDIFNIVSDTPAFKISADVIASINEQMQAGTLTVGPESTKLDVGLGYAAMLEVTNSEHRVYIRYGSNANTGNEQHELIIVDAEGNIDPTTPFLLDYDKVTSITVHSIDDAPLTIEGGHFITIAPDYNTDAPGAISDYYDRGINFYRSNLTVKNIKHDVQNQKAYDSSINPGWDPIPYHGFYSFNNCNNVTIENCTMTARAGHGTYDFSAGMANNLTAVNCKMTNFFVGDDTLIASVQRGYWGVMGSSYCKNITFDNCDLTRFDAHAGVYNGKILNSRVALINIIGGGEMLIQDTEIFYHRIIELRSDYGATWDGTIKIYDCTVTSGSSVTPIIDAVWSNHDFGYTCVFPNIEIRNLRSSRNPTTPIPLFRTNHNNSDPNQQIIGMAGDMHKEYLDNGTKNINMVVPPEFIKITSNAYGTKFTCPDIDFLDNTTIIGFNQ